MTDTETTTQKVSEAATDAGNNIAATAESGANTVSETATKTADQAKEATGTKPKKEGFFSKLFGKKK